MKHAALVGFEVAFKVQFGHPGSFSGKFAGITHVFGRRSVCNPHKVKKSDLNWAVKDAFQAAISAGARGMRVRFPEIGAMASRDVKARKAGKGVNPFTGESIMLKARAASKKPRWSFPKAVREAYIRTAARKAA